MYLLYDFVFLLYALVYLPYLLLTRRWYAGFGMRFGIFSLQIKEQIKARDNIWVHAVSVGEVVVLDGFIDRLRKDHPTYQVVATVTTKTGYELACKILKDKALLLPSPIDFSFIAQRFVSLIGPKVYIAVETEIWPNLYRQLYLKHIPLVVINGRISDGSFGRYKAIRFLLKGILNQVSVWCMASLRDAGRVKELGAESSRVLVTGNLKFDDSSRFLDSSSASFASGKDELWWVAGSTHPGEEDIVLDVYGKIIKDNPNWQLVIAPRHIERVGPIMELISRRGLKGVKFTEIASLRSQRHSNKLSDGEGIGPFETVIVVDTIGQLRSLYAIASLVFVGKSLCVGGGHNVIEPAIYGKAIVIGPKVGNFADIVACFKEGNAIVQVEDRQAFEIAVRALCVNGSKREALGAAAKAVIASNQGATNRSLECLARFLK